MDEVDEKPIINLIFLYLFNSEKKIEFYKLSYDSNIYQINSSNKTHVIPEQVFKYGELKAKISIELYKSSKEIYNTINFPVDYCKNNIYIQIDSEGFGANFNCIFKNIKDLNIIAQEKKLDLLDNCGTKDRKKLTILNYNAISIKINDKVIYLNNYSNPFDFVQYSIDLSDFKVIVKKSEKLNQPDLHFLMKKKINIQNFYKELTELFMNQKDYHNQNYHILNYYKKIIGLYDFNLHLPKENLKEYFKIHNIELETIFKYNNFFLFYEGKKKYSKDIILFKEIYNKLNEFYTKIKNEESLEIYDKIILLCRISRILFNSSDYDSLKETNIQYSIVSKCDPNSIIGKAIKFYDDYIENLTDKSKVFHYLVNLDSGLGEYGEESVYAFDMTNLKMIKAHLKELRPKVIIFFTFKNNNIANTQKSFPCVAINRYNFFKESLEKEINLENKLEVNEETINDFAINLFILLYHESMGHQKFAYNKNECVSPTKIINESNTLITLKKFCDFKEHTENVEYILGEDCFNKGDSGTFMELTFGKFGRRLITSLMLEVKGKGNLINRIDLFTGENCEILKKYITLKYLAKERKINISKQKTIEEEIQELEKFINYEEAIIENNNEKKKESKLIGHKTKRTSDEKNIDSNSELEESKDKNKKKKYDKSEIENMNNTIFPEKKESKNEGDNKSKNNDDDDDYIDDATEFQKLYKKIICKYGFKTNGNILKEIKEKMKDKSIDIDELYDLRFVYDYLCDVN